MPDLDAAGEGQGGKGERLEHRQCLGDDDEISTGVSIRRQSAEGSEGKDRDLAAEPGCAEQQLRVCQTVDEPALGDGLHPGADQGDDLAADEEAEIAVAEGAERVP